MGQIVKSLVFVRGDDPVMDESLLRFDTVWAAGGTPDTVFPVAPRALVATDVWS